MSREPHCVTGTRTVSRGTAQFVSPTGTPLCHGETHNLSTTQSSSASRAVTQHPMGSSSHTSAAVNALLPYKAGDNKLQCSSSSRIPPGPTRPPLNLAIPPDGQFAVQRSLPNQTRLHRFPSSVGPVQAKCRPLVSTVRALSLPSPATKTRSQL